MKKTYIAPFCKIREVKKCDIIATSGFGTNDVVGNKSVLGRGSSWDDDEDDEW